jgi:hypothetical protein
MTTNRAMELLYDSEATLRLVDHELEALGQLDGVNPAPEAPAEPDLGEGPESASLAGLARINELSELSSLVEDVTPTSALAMVPHILHKANTEIINVLGSLRQCRSAIEQATSDKLQITHEKIREVTNATETAATDILDGLDRAQVLLDDLDAEAESNGDGSEKAKDLRSRLRDEIFMMTGCLQFQDITTQQLTYAASMLVEMESRLAEIARLFDPRRYGAPELPPELPAVPEIFTPDAAYDKSDTRQAVADQIFHKGE